MSRENDAYWHVVLINIQELKKPKVPPSKRRGLGVMESYREMGLLESYRELGVMESYRVLGVKERY